MLVLTRKVGEEVVIAGEIRLTVLEVRGDRIRIGVSAPASIRVDRGEIHERRNNPSRFAAAAPTQLEPLFASAH